MKVLHLVGGSSLSGAYKGAYILHEALKDSKIDSIILNDNPQKNLNRRNVNVIYINKNFFFRFLNKTFVIIEKILKSIFLKSSRSTFTIGLLGFDITKIQQYKEADIVHIHWLGQGFIRLQSLCNIKKPIVWTMRDMWPFTGGAHYTMDFEKYEKGYLSRIIKNFKKKIYKKNIQFVAISEWLKIQAKKSHVLKKHKIKRIYNNIDLRDFNLISKKKAKKLLKIKTKKTIILFGAQNTQSTRKGWDIFVKTLKKLDKSKYFLLIFGNFWSYEILNSIGIEYKVLGFVDNKKILNAAYSSADFFLFASIQEAFGKTWAEAMACGIPVICFNNTSVAEIIDHKKNGYIVKEVNSEKLKKAIEWMSIKTRQGNYKPNKTREKVNIFDAKKIAREYINLYKKILR